MLWSTAKNEDDPKGSIPGVGVLAAPYPARSNMLSSIPGVGALAPIILVIGFILIPEHSIAVEKQPKSELPIIFNETYRGSERMNDTEKEYEYLRKFYGINTLQLLTYHIMGEFGERWSPHLENLKNAGFFRSFLQTGSENTWIFKKMYEHKDGDKWEQRVPYGVDEDGNVLKKAICLDRISPRYFSDYIRPWVDVAVANHFDILSLVEYHFFTPCFSDDDIAQFRTDLMGEDEGVDWLFYDKHIEHLNNFWEYAKVQVGITRDDFPPDSLGNFSSYNEYRPEKTCDRVADQSSYYRSNRFIFDQLIEYEYFKVCQKWYKLAKEKGMKYCAWTRGNRIPRDICHDPYVDYIGYLSPISVAHNRAVPWGIRASYNSTWYRDASTLEAFEMGAKYFNVLNDEIGKANVITYETVTMGRMPVDFYIEGFSSLVHNATLNKPRFFYPEFAPSESVFDTGYADSLREYNLTVIESWREVIESGLNTGRILRSNWLIQCDPEVFTGFGWARGLTFNTNLGDMRTEFLLNGYIFDVEPSNGTDRLPMESYKVVTMGGRFFGSPVIDHLKKWINEGNGRTLVTNSLYLGNDLGNRFVGSRYTDLGIWNTANIIEHNVKEITWVDTSIFPDIELGKYSLLNAALPAENIMSALPKDAKVVMKGRIDTGEEVPLVFIVPKGNNTIINITFALKEFRDYHLPPSEHHNDIYEFSDFNLEFGKTVMFNLFSYIQKKNQFRIPNVKCDYSMYHVARSATLDNKGVVTVSALGQARIGEENSSHYLIDPFVLEYEDHKIVSKIHGRSLVIGSLDGSALSSVSGIKIDDTLYVKSVEPESLYLLVAIDGKSYNDSKLFHLWTHKDTVITFLRPKEWKDKTKIKIYNFEGKSVVEMDFKLTDKYITFKPLGRKEYKISYGGIEKSLWTKFCQRLSQEKEELAGRFDDSTWKKVSLNSIVQEEEVAWYRLHFKVPVSWKGESLVLDFGESVRRDRTMTFFNGKGVGGDTLGLITTTTKRRYVIPKQIIKYGEDNVIAVQIYSAFPSTPFNVFCGSPVRLINPAKGEDIDFLNSEWLYLKGGDRSCAKY